MPTRAKELTNITVTNKQTLEKLAKLRKLKVAIVHEILLMPGGAENVVLELLKIFPHADVFTVFYNKQAFENADPKWKLLTNRKIITSKYNFLVNGIFKKLPDVLTNYRNFFFLWPKIMESFDLTKYDIVISSHYLGAHGVITQENTLHISYTHTPARYFYSHYHEYMNSPFMNQGIKKLKKLIFPSTAHKFRIWDLIASHRPDYYIANSTAVKNRIKKYYNRKATVIYAPVDVSKIKITKPVQKQDYYFTITRLVPQKKVDIMIKACKKLGKKLIVGGKGVDMPRLKAIAGNAKNIIFKGFVSDEEKIKLYRHAKAFLFASYEDFGIVPIEALAAGTPVIAFNKGGTKDYVIPGKTGILFNEQTPESLANAILKFEKQQNNFNQMELVKFAETFSEKNFQENIINFIYNKWIKKQKDLQPTSNK